MVDWGIGGKMQVLLFAGLEEIAGTNVVVFSTKKDLVHIKDIKEFIIRKYPTIKVLLEQSMIAVNCEYVDEDCMVTSKDKIAFIPPVSGG